MEILSKTKDISERLFYIHECAVKAWDKYTFEMKKALPDVDDLRKLLVSGVQE